VMLLWETPKPPSSCDSWSRMSTQARSWVHVLYASRVPFLKRVKVAQVGLGGAHGPKILKHVAELFTNSLNIVTLFKAACVVTGGL
jgi:hypothetical protein